MEGIFADFFTGAIVMETGLLPKLFSRGFDMGEARLLLGEALGSPPIF